jgi:hypothetical protein
MKMETWKDSFCNTHNRSTRNGYWKDDGDGDGGGAAVATDDEEDRFI